MPFVNSGVKPKVITRVCAMIPTSSQIHFVSEQRYKQCCIYVLNQNFLMQNLQSETHLWPLVGYLEGFQKQLKTEKLHAYFILFTSLNQNLCIFCSSLQQRHRFPGILMRVRPHLLHKMFVNYFLLLS